VGGGYGEHGGRGLHALSGRPKRGACVQGRACGLVSLPLIMLFQVPEALGLVQRVQGVQKRAGARGRPFTLREGLACKGWSRIRGAQCGFPMNAVGFAAPVGRRAGAFLLWDSAP